MSFHIFEYFCLPFFVFLQFLVVVFWRNPPDKVVKFFGGRKLFPKPYQGHTRQYPVGYYTDDTAMTICLTESLTEKGFNIQDQFQRYRRWLFEGYATPEKDIARGIGQHTLMSLTLQKEDNLPTQLMNDLKGGGNGALMRTAPIGLLYHSNEAELVDKSIASAIITHNNPISAWSCVILNCFIAYSLQGLNKDRFIDKFLSSHSKDCPPELLEVLSQDFDLINETSLANTGYTLNTLNIALYSFLTTANYRDCVAKSIFIGGDTDTQGAVAGALAGAYYGLAGIPEEWVSVLTRKDYILDLADRLCGKLSLVS